MATAGPVHFEIPTYSEFGVTMTWYTSSAKTATVDLSSYTAAMDIRRKQSDSTALIALTSSSGISLGGTDGTITISLTDTQTAAITPGFGVWDLELIDSGGSNLRLVEGTCEFTPSVTRN
jgi:hypothetical protein|tara:strand:- start:88 stop:447 length:360 start_codon:yes stop_codon:yes gene_type:complete